MATPYDPKWKWLTSALPMVISTLIGLVIVEGTLRLMDHPSAPKIGWGWSQSPYANADFKNAEPPNKLGLRGQNFEINDTDFVVLLVGDSYVEAGLQPAHDMPAIILEQALKDQYNISNAKVFSLASAGWGQDQQLQAMERYFSDYRANLVLLWLTPVNDYWENTFVDRSTSAETGHLKPTLEWVDGQWDWFDFSLPPLKILQLINLSLAQTQHNRATPLASQFRAKQQANLPVSMRPPQSDGATAKSCPDRTITQSELILAYRTDPSPFSVTTEEDFSNGRSHFVPFATTPSPLESYEVDVTLELLTRIHALTKAQDTPLRMIYPAGSDIDRAFAAIGCIIDINGSQIPIDADDTLKHLRTSNFDGLIIDTQISSPRPTILAEDDWHLNREGNELFLDAVLKKLSTTELLPARPQRD